MKSPDSPSPAQSLLVKRKPFAHRTRLKHPDTCRAGTSLPGIERVLGFFIEFVLQFEAGLISLHRPDAPNDAVDPGIHAVLAQFFRGHRSVSRIVLREPGVPPNSRIQVSRKM